MRTDPSYAFMYPRVLSSRLERCCVESVSEWMSGCPCDFKSKHTFSSWRCVGVNVPRSYSHRSWWVLLVENRLPPSQDIRNCGDGCRNESALCCCLHEICQPVVSKIGEHRIASFRSETFLALIFSVPVVNWNFTNEKRKLCLPWKMHDGTNIHFPCE